jgi:hypothetical protein
MKTMEPKLAANYLHFMKREISTVLVALSLLFAVVSAQGSYRGPEYGGYYGHEYGHSTYGYPTYGYGPSIDGPAYVGNPWGYGFDRYGFDGWSDYELPPPAPNPVGPSKTIEIPPDHSK